MDLDAELVNQTLTEQNKDYNTIKKLDFSHKQIEDWGNIEAYIGKLIGLNHLDFSSNYIERIFPDVNLLDNLQTLDLTENLIVEITSISGHPSLKELNLSSNRIKSLDGLEDLPTLHTLNVSNNFLIRMDQLDLPHLKKLDLSSNEITAMEGLEKLDSIVHLNMAKNLINDLDYLMVLKFNNLEEIDFGFNRIQMSYLDNLFEILKEIGSLRKVTFAGNELCFNKLYKMKISMMSNLTHLDSLEIRAYARKALQNLNDGDEIDKLISSTRNEYMQRISTEEELKNNILNMLDQQKLKIENQFTKYKNEMEDDQVNFIKWSQRITHDYKDDAKTVSSKF